ncbi:MAG: N-acetylneuraminate lyase [Paenibacillus sp.]|jgi:N-acetylneuraminate lyase|nr:N-acetylneuraminate lyase [Paenibacillus sp.]
MTTKDSAELARHAERAGADAISSVPPFYYAYTEQAVKDYWLEAINSADLPFLIYHIPGATGFQVTPRLVRDLREAAPDRIGWSG